MATTETTPALNVTKERVTYCLVKNLKAPEGTDPYQFATETAANRGVEAKEFEIVATQSFLKPVVSGYEGIKELFGDAGESEAAKLANRGIDSKAYQYIRAKILEKDEEENYIFQAQEGDIDLTETVAQVSAGRASTPEAKMEKVLAGLDEATATALMERLLAKMRGGA